MAAILPTLDLTRPPQGPGYLQREIAVLPNPPLIGSPALVTLRLSNPSSASMIVREIVFSVAHYGMGVTWEQLPVVGPLTIAAGTTETITVEWTPYTGGHRCVKAQIDLGNGLSLSARCNLNIMRSPAEQDAWLTRFQVGNPTEERAALRFTTAGEAEQLQPFLRINHRSHALDEPLWLDPGEVAHAIVLLRARSVEAIEAQWTMEAWMHGTILDGIGVAISRPANILPPTRSALTLRQKDIPRTRELIGGRR